MTITEALRKYENVIGCDYSEIDSLDTAQTVFEDLTGALSSRKIILYGARCTAADLITLFREIGIPVEFVVAKNWAEVGIVAGMPVEPPEKLKTVREAEKYWLIAACAPHIMKDIQRDLDTLETDFNHLECGYSLGILLQSAWCIIKSSQNKKIDLRCCHDCICADGVCKSLNLYLKSKNRFQEEEATGTNALTAFDYLLSNKCTLRCRNCAEGIPYIPAEQRHFVSGTEVIKDIKKLCKACRFVARLSFVGGEPFLHPELAYILEHVLAVRNIGVVEIFSNGTVSPDEKVCAYLADPRIVVYISNYRTTCPEHLRSRIDRTVEQMENHGVQWVYGKTLVWKDLNDCFPREKDISFTFQTCPFRYCTRIMEGTLYMCSFQCTGIQLRRLEDENTLSIHSYTDEDLACALEKFKAVPYIEACKYCAMPDAPDVLAGEQL